MNLARPGYMNGWWRYKAGWEAGDRITQPIHLHRFVQRQESYLPGLTQFLSRSASGLCPGESLSPSTSDPGAGLGRTFERASQGVNGGGVGERKWSCIQSSRARTQVCVRGVTPVYVAVPAHPVFLFRCNGLEFRLGPAKCFRSGWLKPNFETIKRQSRCVISIIFQPS